MSPRALIAPVLTLLVTVATRAVTVLEALGKLVSMLIAGVVLYVVALAAVRVITAVIDWILAWLGDER